MLGKEENNFKDKQMTSRFLASISGLKARPFTEIRMVEEKQVRDSECHFKDIVCLKYFEGAQGETGSRQLDLWTWNIRREV